MKNKKLVILMIAVVAIGVFALPTTLSVGQGQHKFRQAGSAETDLVTFCGQCHGATDALYTTEIAQSDHSVLYGDEGAGTTRVHGSLFLPGALGCAACHEISTNYGDVTQLGSKVEHAAKIPSCRKCHAAGPDLITNDVAVELGVTTEAHRNFAAADATSGTQNDLSCIGCHTYVTKSGQITYSYEPGTFGYNGLSITGN